MKVRTGFVSNSSSSSFCIYGTRLSEPKEIELAEQKSKEASERKISYYWYDDCLYIGRSFYQLKDNETGECFKQRTEKDLAEILGKKVNGYIMEECWYDG